MPKHFIFQSKNKTRKKTPPNPEIRNAIAYPKLDSISQKMKGKKKGIPKVGFIKQATKFLKILVPKQILQFWTKKEEKFNKKLWKSFYRKPIILLYVLLREQKLRQSDLVIVRISLNLYDRVPWLPFFCLFLGCLHLTFLHSAVY